MCGRNCVLRNAAVVGIPIRRIADNRNSELGVADAVAGNANAVGRINENTCSGIARIADVVWGPDIRADRILGDAAGSAESNLNRILRGTRSGPLANYRVAGNRHVGSRLIPGDSVLLIVLYVIVVNIHDGRTASTA